jgi:pilus assembly protein CpaB
MRAAAVRVDEVVGVSGFVVPGMRVDILASGTPPGQYGTVTRTILQNIAVLSAGQNLERDAQGKPASVQSVNLLVTPEEAEKLSLASGQMKVQLVLRNPLDVTTVTTRGISGGDLLLDRAPAESKAAPRSRTVASRAPAAAPAPARTAQAAVPFTMEMIQGAKRETVVVGQAAEGVNGGGR